MSSTPQQFSDMQDRLRTAQRERAHALATIMRLSETGQREKVIPFLMANMARRESLKGIRLWQLDNAMFGRSRRSAQTTIRHMRETIGDTSTVKDGYTTVGWALEDQQKSVRMSTWLYMLLLREHIASFDLPDGFPYALLYDN